jgi:Trk-type K+ transport system membrane component
MVSRHDCTNFDVCPGFTYPTLLLTSMVRISDWVFFLVLDIGNAAFSQLSVGLQVIDGLLQASTIRTAGFSVVSIAALAPAVKLVFLLEI